MKRLLIPLVGAFLLTSCTKTPDRTLEARLAAHKEAFVALGDMAREDYRQHLPTLSLYLVRSSRSYEQSDHQGVSEARWTMYQDLLAEVGLHGIVSDGNKVQFLCDRIGEFSKGILFSESEPGPLLSSLDDFEPRDEFRTTDHGGFMGYKSVSQNWYLWAHYF